MDYGKILVHYGFYYYVYCFVSQKLPRDGNQWSIKRDFRLWKTPYAGREMFWVCVWSVHVWKIINFVNVTDNSLRSSCDRCQKWNRDLCDDHGRRIGFHQQVREQLGQPQRQSVPTSFWNLKKKCFCNVHLWARQVFFNFFYSLVKDHFNERLGHK